MYENLPKNPGRISGVDRERAMFLRLPDAGGYFKNQHGLETQFYAFGSAIG